MHEIQIALLNVIQERGLREFPPLRKLAEFTGKSISAQQVKHHLEQLEKKGFFSVDRKTGAIHLANNTQKIKKTSFVTLPIYGVANCGPALSIAEQRPEGFLKISLSLLKNKNIKDLFVVKASGNSMNKALINKKNIEDGDYLVIESLKLGGVKGVGEVVLSIIDGAANIKRIYKKQDHIVLVSDSTKDYPPIYIDHGSEFIVNGQIVEVMKNPKQ